MKLVFSTPVTLPDSWAGLATNRGVLRLDPDQLVIEFETKDGVFEAVSSGVQKVALPLEAVDSLVWQAGWWRAALELRVTSLDLLRDLPGSDQGRIRLKVARRDRQAAARLADEVELALAGRVAHHRDDHGFAPVPTNSP